MLTSRQRPIVRTARREMLAWLILLSLALHLALIACLLMLRPTQPLTDLSEPLSVEIIAGGEPAQMAQEPAVAAEASAAPIASAAPAPQAEIPPPTAARLADAVLTPTAPVVEAPTPTPTQTAAPVPVPEPTAQPLPVPDVPPALSVQPAELPLPTPPPPPVPQAPAQPPTQTLPPSPPHPPAAKVVQAHPAPPRPPVARPAAQRRSATEATGTAPAPSVGMPAATEAQAGGSRMSAASSGAAWMGRLKQWWDQHSFYPKEASQTNEGGNVRVRIGISPDGQVMSISVVQGSGSSVLDAAALAVFRNARLPPLPPGTLAQPADVVVTLHYRPADGD